MSKLFSVLKPPPLNLRGGSAPLEFRGMGRKGVGRGSAGGGVWNVDG